MVHKSPESHQCVTVEPQASSSCAGTTRLFSPNGANICGHFRAQLHLVSYSWSPQQSCPLSWKVNRADISCALYKNKCILKPAWQQVMGLELFISLITCSPSSCTRSPQQGILTLACLYCLKNRQVMKLRVHGEIVTSSGSLFSALIIPSCMSSAAAAEHRVGIHTRGTTVLQQPKSRESTHQITTKTQSTEPQCFFPHCCA